MNRLYDRLAGDSIAAARVVAVNKVLTAVGYVAYPLLLVMLALYEPSLLVTRISVPAAAFIVVSLFRYFYNAPRPYTVDPTRPALNGKSKPGKSFPSRHTFCMFMIAFAWISWVPWGIAPGCLLVICAVALAISRIALGVHYPRDVVAGALAALVFSLVGYPLASLALI